MLEKTDWRIWVNGYGEFDFTGTEQEAEEMRAHKARWEGGIGKKWRADLRNESDRLTQKLVSIWETGEGAPVQLLKKIKKAKLAEAK